MRMYAVIYGEVGWDLALCVGGAGHARLYSRIPAISAHSQRTLPRLEPSGECAGPGDGNDSSLHTQMPSGRTGLAAHRCSEVHG